MSKFLSQIIFVFFLAVLVAPSLVFAGVPKGNGAWTYDTLYDSSGNKIGTKPGLHAPTINSYNATAGAGHKITQVFSYGGDISMYCRGSGGSSSGTPCTASTLKVNYNSASTQAYYSALGGSVSVMPVCDGEVGGYYLSAFNTMDQATAELFADMVSKTYCADSNIIGVQFDIEKLDMTQRGQVYFYTQIAKNFSGNHSSSDPNPYRCVDSAHPKGRIFSVFATSGKVDSTLAGILNKYDNGFIAGPLYSLGTTSSKANSPDAYATMATAEVKRMVSRGATYNVKYQFGIPTAASIQEFEKRGGISSGYKQLDYVKNAINIINQYARGQSNFVGVDWWAFRSKAYTKGIEIQPAEPPADVKSYLATRLFNENENENFS